MSKYSRKVKTWGALPEFTEHRNKKGQVTARTEYFEGKAYTVRVPRHKTSASERAAIRRHQRAVNDLFTLGPGVKAALYIGSAIILLLAGIGWVVNQVATALAGFWPVFGSILAWAALAGWGISLLVAAFATWKRGLAADSVTYAVLQGLGLAAVSLAAIVPLTGFDRYENSAFSSWVTLSGLVAVLIAVVSGIVFAFRYDKRWLWFSLAALVFSIACAFFTPLGVAGGVIAVVVALGRYNWRAATE